MDQLLNTLVLLGGFAIVAVAAKQIASFFREAKLPIITGLLVIGLFSGPYLFKLLPKGTSSGLQFINDISLAFIAFAAAAELYIKEMRSRFKSIKWMTFGQLGVTFIFSSILIFFLADYIGFMKEMNPATKIAVAILMATIFVARSPASAIAVINELRAKGPFVQMAMGVTVVKDFLVILLFAICFTVSQTLVSGEPFTLSFIAILLGELVASFVLGWVVGKLLSMILSIRMHQNLKAGCILGLGYSVYLLNHFVEHYSYDQFGYKIHLEPLFDLHYRKLYPHQLFKIQS